MVLPWVSDRRSPAFRQGLLGCSYFDSESNDMIFAVDERYRLNLEQSPFMNLRKPVTEINRLSTCIEDTNQISNLRKYYNDVYVPSSVLLNCMNEFNAEAPKNDLSNKLSFRSNPNYPGQYIAVYPNINKNTISIDLLEEIELESNQTALNIFERHEIDFPFIIKQIKSFSGESFAVSSSQTVRMYSNSNDSFRTVLEYISPDDDYISCMDICRNDLEISVILQGFKRLIVRNLISSYEFNLSADFSNCSYSAHPSLLALSGNTDRIELKDLRGAFSEISISDRSVPFRNVQALITHHTDPNLIAVSCQTEIFNPIANSDTFTSEIRVYDIRYPKESTMRIASDSPISHFVSFKSYADIDHDCLIGLDAESTPWLWELRHSKSNEQFLDGVLSMTDCLKLSKASHPRFSGNREYTGYSVDHSYSHNETLFITRLADDGELEYCIISDTPSNQIFEPIPSDEMAGEVLDFCHLSDQFLRRKVKIISSPAAQNMNNNNFGPMFQSTFHLDFYWEELKTKLIDNGNQ